MKQQFRLAATAVTLALATAACSASTTTTAAQDSGVSQKAEAALANRGPQMDVAEAQAKLAEALAQLQALERMRKTLKH